MRIKFEGAEADGHKLEAYEGLKSIEGLVRVARIATHYVATSEVRFRAPYTNLLEAQISQVNNGSFEMIFDYASRLVDSVQAFGAKSKAEALFQYLVERGTGQTEIEDFTFEGVTAPSGDVAAMAEAAEAGLKSAHRWINLDEKTISVIDGDRAVTLDLGTREYVEEEVIGDVDDRDVSVAAMNVNSKNGRVYLIDEHRTVPFVVDKNAEGRTVSNLSRYLMKYAEKSGETVNIRYRPVRHVDERIKRLIIYDCYPLEDAA